MSLPARTAAGTSTVSQAVWSHRPALASSCESPGGRRWQSCASDATLWIRPLVTEPLCEALHCPPEASDERAGAHRREHAGLNEPFEHVHIRDEGWAALDVGKHDAVSATLKLQQLPLRFR